MISVMPVERLEGLVAVRRNQQGDVVHALRLVVTEGLDRRSGSVHRDVEEVMSRPFGERLDELRPVRGHSAGGWRPAIGELGDVGKAVEAGAAEPEWEDGAWTGLGQDDVGSMCTNSPWYDASSLVQSSSSRSTFSRRMLRRFFGSTPCCRISASFQP